MSAQLNLNTHQAYGYFYDQLASGWGVPQNSVGPTQNSDPCAGRKGKLNFFPSNPNHGISHIIDRHIDRSKNVGASKYTFPFWQNSLIDKQTSVMNLDQETFANAVGFPQRDGRAAYVYALSGFDYSVKDPLGGVIGARGFYETGIDRNHGGNITNVNTLVVGPDCNSVITSFPGLPTGMSPNDPRITGTPMWGTAPPGFSWRR